MFSASDTSVTLAEDQLQQQAPQQHAVSHGEVNASVTVEAAATDEFAEDDLASSNDDNHPQMSSSAEATANASMGAASAASAMTNAPSGQQFQRPPPRCNVYICMLPQTIRDPELAELFSPYGEIVSAKVMLNIHTGIPRGIGFVQYSKPESAARAVEEMNEKRVGDRVIGVRIAEESASYVPPAPSSKIFVRNIPLTATRDELMNFFSKFGAIRELTIHSDTAVKKAPKKVQMLHPRNNIAFITFEQIPAAQAAADAVHNTTPFENATAPLMAKVAVKASSRPANSGPGRGAGGRFGREDFDTADVPTFQQPHHHQFQHQQHYFPMAQLQQPQAQHQQHQRFGFAPVAQPQFQPQYVFQPSSVPGVQLVHATTATSAPVGSHHDSQDVLNTGAGGAAVRMVPMIVPQQQAPIAAYPMLQPGFPMFSAPPPHLQPQQIVHQHHHAVQYQNAPQQQQPQQQQHENNGDATVERSMSHSSIRTASESQTKLDVTGGAPPAYFAGSAQQQQQQQQHHQQPHVVQFGGAAPQPHAQHLHHHQQHQQQQVVYFMPTPGGVQQVSASVAHHHHHHQHQQQQHQQQQVVYMVAPQAPQQQQQQAPSHHQHQQAVFAPQFAAHHHHHHQHHHAVAFAPQQQLQGSAPQH